MSSKQKTNDEPAVHEYSVCFLFTPDGRSVLLQTKNRTAFAGRLNGVGGKRKPNETMLDCARRKIKAETGIDVDEDDLLHVMTTALNEDCAARDGNAKCVLHFFAAVVDPAAVKPPKSATEKVAFYDTINVLDLPVRHAGMAGHGDVQYVVNVAYRELNVRGRFDRANYVPLPRLADVTTAHKGKHVSVMHAEYEMPNHEIKTYEVATRRPGVDIRGGAARPDGVSILLFDKSGDYVLLEREFRMGVGEHVYNLPMGLIEPDERPADAIKRELFEETGIVNISLAPSHPCLPTAYTAPGMSNQSDQLFIGFVEANLHEPNPVPVPARPSPHEFTKPVWMDRKTVASFLYDDSLDKTPFSARTQALIHGWLCGANYIRRA